MGRWESPHPGKDLELIYRVAGFNQQFLGFFRIVWPPWDIGAGAWVHKCGHKAIGNTGTHRIVLVNNALLETLSETTPASPADLKGLKEWHANIFGEDLFNILCQ